MKQNYTTQMLRVVVAQVCQTIGWQSVTSAALEIMVDMLDRYLKEICKTSHNYAELYNRTDSNIDDLSLAFRDMGINMNEIIEYIQYVDPVVPPIDVPKYPISKESHLNFLKPGSKEVLTRPVHIHEHLPPINPPEDEPLYNGHAGEKEIDVVGVPDDAIFKRPADGSLDQSTTKKTKMEEEGRPTREITSVMMTTSGFISPAREGKLPEAKAPNLPPEFPKPAPPAVALTLKKDPAIVTSGSVDKKLEKKLKKKNHDKEKRKEKFPKDKFPIPASMELIPLSNPNQITTVHPVAMPREANEQLVMAERKKELKKLKIKNKAAFGLPKKKKEKPPKPMKGATDSNSMILPKFDPFQSMPLPPPASSHVQAHNFLAGSAHSLFPNPMLDQNLFAATQIPSHHLIEGKLVSEPDKQKLNIFKKISKPKDDPIKSNSNMQTDFLSPGKFDRFEMNQPSTSQQQIFTDPLKKTHKLPKETTLTRIEAQDTGPINFSMSRSNESSFDEMLPKTPTIPRTPDMKLNQGAEKKKKRKDKEKKTREPEWNPSIQNPFMQDLAQTNPFLQTFTDPGSLMGNFTMANPFNYLNPGLYPSDPNLMARGPFGIGQNLFQNPFPMSGMDMNMIQPKPKKVKVPKQTFQEDSYLQTSLKFGNVPPLMAPSVKERFETTQQPSIVAPFPSQSQQLSTFDQLLKDQSKKYTEEKMETFDLTKDSSPEPTTPAPIPQQQQQSQQQQSSSSSNPPAQQPELNAPEQPIKEKSKEKKKKKDKDKDKDERKKDKKKKDKKDRKDKKDKDEKKKKKEKRKEKARASMSTLDSQSTNDTDTGDNNSTSSIPKLMLKLNSPRPNTPDMHKKLFHRNKPDEFEFPSPSSLDTNLNRDEAHGSYRDASPELVRISPLVTRPPKQKPSTSLYSSPVEHQNYQNPYNYNQNDQGGLYYQSSYQHPTHYQQLEPPAADAEIWNISQNKASYIQDADGKEVWICPACGKVDDGTPMIGCDSCDAWYHWACVGIRVEPKENEDWFCRVCIARKQNDMTDGKKKKRKKKDKDKRDH